MSDVKVQEKVSTEPKKAKTEKTDTAPKSASQSSISHFSSVSTPAYKEGWENIFGKSKIDQTKAPSMDNGELFPEKLTIDNADIDKELRSALYKAFKRQALAQGMSLAKINK